MALPELFLQELNFIYSFSFLFLYNFSERNDLIMAEPNTDTTPPTDPKTSTPLTDDEGKAIDDAVAAGKSEECIYLL